MLGALGRISQHLSETRSNTFRQRLCKIYGYANVKLENIKCFAFYLEHRSEYSSESRDYREAVEYNTQLNVLNGISQIGVHVLVVSRVMHSGYSSLDWIKKDAGNIAEQICAWLVASVDKQFSG